jgi:SAM-dependent methyltransferase
MGNFDIITGEQGALFVEGWMMLSERPCDSFDVYFNEKYVGSTSTKVREDLAAGFPHVPHARQSGFHLHAQLPITQEQATVTGRFDVIGYSGEKPIARFGPWFAADLDSVPTPPPALMKRVSAIDDPAVFKQGGLNNFHEFLGALNRHAPATSFRRMLDWGCGCGRITAHFLHLPNGPEVLGCDIDAEAVAWCNYHLKAEAFRTIAPLPPMPYEDGAFDLVIGYSIFTHLTRQAQEAWLAEMRRVIRPGGFFLASTHGTGAAARLLRRGDRFRMAWSGVYDGIQDQALAGIAPDSYYRTTFQTRRYTLREWGRHFEVVDYIEQGLGGFQDLVVMRRPT